MKITGIIPARYESSRIPGKPLADICGKPMIWWVYQEAMKVSGLDELVIAVDDDRVMNVCKSYNMNAVMTRNDHEKHINRLHEVSEKMPADYYICICGDEPLVEATAVKQVFPKPEDDSKPHTVRSLMRDFDDPTEAVDTASMKVAINHEGECIFISRSIIPFPYKTVEFPLRRLVGIECFSKSALDFFDASPPGVLEKIEDITLLRFLENHIPIQLVETHTKQIGVDTLKNLEVVRKIISERLHEKKEKQ